METAINQDLKALIFSGAVSAEYVGSYFVALGSRLLPLITKSGATVQSINTEQFEDLEIPVPPRDVQDEIVKRLLAAFKSKHEKENRARQLFASVDGILSDELGMQTSAQERTIQGRIFTTSFRDVTGDRFDPEIVLFRRQTHKSKYPSRRFCTLFTQQPQYGSGARGLNRKSLEQARYIRITDIDEYGNLSDELGATSAGLEDRYSLQDDDLLIARSGNTVGKAYLHKTALQPYQCFYAGYLIRFRLDASIVSPDYVFAITQSSYYKAWVRATQRAAGQPNINAREYSNLQIPLPSLPVQNRIVSRIRVARDDARELRRKAIAEFEESKKSIQALILGPMGAA